ncbi:hypothetical protein FRC03_011273 [Tulasnella sp. 419]|nr:hypothetical protein FRC02_005560 [Tulasnella sp. 418]KAG8955238.1 hypothetical protein FRC03_011273 [Tulasnella sp. 419]
MVMKNLMEGAGYDHKTKTAHSTVLSTSPNDIPHPLLALGLTSKYLYALTAKYITCWIKIYRKGRNSQSNFGPLSFTASLLKKSLRKAVVSVTGVQAGNPVVTSLRRSNDVRSLTIDRCEFMYTMLQYLIEVSTLDELHWIRTFIREDGNPTPPDLSNLSLEHFCHVRHLETTPQMANIALSASKCSTLRFLALGEEDAADLFALHTQAFAVTDLPTLPVLSEFVLCGTFTH